MPKTINITNIDIKEFAISKDKDKFNVRIVYSYLDEDEKSLNQKADSFKDEELTPGIKKHLTNILTFLGNELKKKEGI